ncbi:MAG: serine/threonine-protein kinase [Phycisphaerales bacterium]
MLKLVSVKNAAQDEPKPGLIRLLTASAYLADNELADAIVENCASLDALGLDIFLRAIPDLASRPVALDAAIEVTLQSMRRGGAEGDEAAATLARNYPLLASAIQTAHALGEAMVSTTSLAMSNSGRGVIVLPFDVGPLQASGLPRYQLHQLLGVGSQGTVYLGQDRSLSEPGSPAWVAVKHVAPGGAADEAVRARKVLHPNVVRTLDKVPGPNGSWMLVFEFVRGGSLEKKWGAKTMPDRARSAAEVMVQIACGVQAAHSAGLIHRDLKPGNVLLADDGTPKVSDFGISHNQSNQIESDRSGSLGFMSPEQFRGASSSVQDDVYGLGGILYWMLTGACPNGATRQAATQRLAVASADRDGELSHSLSGFDEDLTSICLRALTLDPDERYASADRMAMDLGSWLGNEPLRWTRPSIWRQYRLAVRRSPIAWSIAGLGVVAAVALMLTAGYFVGNAELARERASVEALSRQNSEQQLRLQTANMMTSLMTKYLRNVSDEDMGANWVHILTFIESMMGTRTSDDPTDTEQLWLSRVRVAKNAIAEARANGRGNDLEPLMLESSLCLWLLRTKNGAEALEHLDAIEPKWRKMLSPNDQWFIFMDVFRRCGEMLTVDPDAPDAAVQRRTLFAAARERSKDLGQTGRPVRMLLEKLQPIAESKEIVRQP